MDTKIHVNPVLSHISLLNSNSTEIAGKKRRKKTCKKKKKEKKKHFDIAFVSNPVTMYNRLCILFLRSGLECQVCMMIITVCEGMLADLTLRPLRFMAMVGVYDKEPFYLV